MNSKAVENLSQRVTKAKRKDITDSVIKKLFALSGNQCAMPSCEVQLVYEKVNAVKGIICHIEAASEGGPRYNLHQTKEQRYDFENLVILCPNCHKDIDTNPEKYTVEDIRKFKEEHESKFKKNQYTIPEHLLKIYKLSINEDSFAPELLEFFLNLYLKTDNDTIRKTIYENRIKYCLTNLNLKSIEDKAELKLYTEKILALCSIFEDEMFIRCYFLLTDASNLDLISPEIKNRFSKFLESNYESSEIPRIFWIVHPFSMKSLDLLIKESSKYNSSLFNDILL